jgi:two-component system chemotaxis response regulator CheY
VIIPSDLRVLVVDDNEYARAIARASLTKLGITKVVEATGGAEAVVLAANQAFDVVLTDWYMPDINGAGLTSILRDPRFLKKRLPVVVMTAYASRENVNRARDLHVDELLVKPFTTSQLGTCLLKAISSAEQERSAAGDDEDSGADTDERYVV